MAKHKNIFYLIYSTIIVLIFRVGSLNVRHTSLLLEASGCGSSCRNVDSRNLLPIALCHAVLVTYLDNCLHVIRCSQ